MVESLKELNKKCQKPDYRRSGNWMVRHILRDAALPITWLLLHFKVTANQVTFASLMVGLCGIAFFSFSSREWFFIGTIALQFWYLLDHVDGQIARYRKTASLTGRFFDFLTHHLIHTVIFFSLGVYMAQASGRFFYIVWGFILSMLILSFNLIHDSKSKAFIEKMLTCKTIRVNTESGFTDSAVEMPLAFNSGRNIFTWIHKLCEIHVLMNLFTLCATIQLFWHEFPGRELLFFGYSILIPVLAVGKITYVILNQKCDQEFNRHFKTE